MPWWLSMLCALAWSCAGTAHGEDHPELWFPVGEELVYEISWGILPVAQTRVVTEWTEEEGRRLLAIRYYTKTYGVVAAIYPVDDFIESIIDPATFLPLRFTKNLKEGRHRKHEVTVFDHAAGVARWTNLIKNKGKQFAIEKDTRDIVSMMYYLRSMPFETGQYRSYRVMADEKLYDLYLRVGEEDAIKLDNYGPTRCLRIDPEAAFEGLFVRKGKIVVWVSNDPRRVCIRVRATVPVADIRITLKEVRGPGDDFWIIKRADAGDTEAAAD